jgi:hypothetical protein
MDFEKPKINRYISLLQIKAYLVKLEAIISGLAVISVFQTKKNSNSILIYFHPPVL